MTDLETYGDVVDRVRSGLEGVQYLRPAPERPRRKGAPRALAVAGVTAIVLISGLVVARSGSTSLVWAAEPEVVTGTDVQMATASCQESLDASDPSLDVRVGVLPPMVLMDLRGDRAVATFREGGRYVVCLLDTTVDPWAASIFTAVPYGDEESGTPEYIDGVPILTEEGFQKTDVGEIGEGDEIVGIATGAVSLNVTRVVFAFTVPDLGMAEATTGKGAFAIWWPGSGDCRVDFTAWAFAADGSEVAKSGGACWPTEPPG